MKTRARLLSTALAGASLLALVGAFTWPRSSGEAPAPVVVTEGERAPIHPTPSVPASVWVRADDAPALGSRRVYEVDFSQTVLLSAKADAAAAGDEGSAIIKGLRANWSVTLIAVTKGGLLRYRGVLTDVKAQANGQPYPEGALVQDFGRPFFFDTDGEGKVVSVAFDKALGSDARRTIKALVSGSQVAFHAEGADSWMTHEQDPTGEYEARYTRQGDPRHLRKERTQYLRIATEGGLRPAADQGDVTVRDNTRIETLVGGALDKLASETETDLQFGKGMPRVHLTSVLTLALRQSDVDAAKLQAMNDEWLGAQKGDVATAPMDDDPKAKEAAQREADEKLLKKASITDLERELAAIPKTSSRERAVQMAKLKADFRRHPEDTQKVVSYVRTASIADGQAIAGALGGTATRESLKALVDIANTADTPMAVRTNAIGALAIAQTPSADSVRALQGMTSDASPDISSASTLALGAAAAGVRDLDPGVYQDAIGLLLGNLSRAQTPEAMVLCLLALGNSGDPRVLAAAEKAMAWEDASVRVAAVAAVRFVAGSSTDDFLASAMQSDAAPSVRVQAVSTVEGYRDIGAFVPTFGQLLQTDSSALVRRAVLHALGAIKAEASAMALIASAARNDPAQNVREYAQAIIAAGVQP